MKRLCLLLIVPLLFTGCFGGSSSSESEEIKTKKCTLVSDQSISGYVIKLTGNTKLAKLVYFKPIIFVIINNIAILELKNVLLNSLVIYTPIIKLYNQIILM